MTAFTASNGSLNYFDTCTGGSVTATEGRVWFPTDGSIAVGEYYYDIQATDANTGKITLAYGGYSVVQDITKL